VLTVSGEFGPSPISSRRGEEKSFTCERVKWVALGSAFEATQAQDKKKTKLGGTLRRIKNSAPTLLGERGEQLSNHHKVAVRGLGVHIKVQEGRALGGK